MLGDLYLERQVYPQFFRLYRQILQETPRDLSAYLKLAAVYKELHIDDKARDILNKGLKIDPKNKAILRALLQLK
jgi:Tfp pilus assembly protein PilF